MESKELMEIAEMLAARENAIMDATHFMRAVVDFDRQRQFNAALAKAQAQFPAIIKDAQVNAGPRSFKHATVHQVVDAVRKPLAENGLAFRWETSTGDGIRVSCVLMHESGYEAVMATLTSSPDQQQKNIIQGVGSATSYLQRYTLLSALGLATNEDDDAAPLALRKA